MAVCDKYFQLYTDPMGPYSGDMIAVSPYIEVPYNDASNVDGRCEVTRSPRQTKGLDYRETMAQPKSCC